MTGVENYLNEVICLQLKKPKNWNWQISTSKSSPHIALPTIQLYNSKGKLLVETRDHDATKIQKWNSLPKDTDCNAKHLQRSRSANLEAKLASCRSSSTGKTAPPVVDDPARHVQRCRSDSVALRSYPKKRRSRTAELTSKPTTTNYNDIQGQTNRNSTRLQSTQPYSLKKSRSDVLDIKVKSKLLHVPSDNKQSQRPYHRRSRSDDLFQKTKQKFDLEESRKRAENDGYLKFTLPESGLLDKKFGKLDGKKRERPIGCLSTAETVILNNKPTNIQITEVVKPRRYVLRQSRAGILVLSEESLSASHRKRCHGDLGDCCKDENDILVDEDFLGSLDDVRFLKKKDSLPRKPRRSQSYREVPHIWNKDVEGRVSFPIREGNNRHPDNQLFYSKSDVFPFGKLLGGAEEKYRTSLDENCNYVVNEPLTTSDSDYAKRIVEDRRKAPGSRRRCDYRWTLPSSTESEKGPIIHNQNTSNGDCDLLQLVRRLSPSKVDENVSNRNYPRSSLRSFKPRIDTKQRAPEKEVACHDVMGANVSRHSTKGLSGRRSQSSGSICNGKGRHQGDGSGGSLPSYLDDRGSTSTNNYDDERRSQLDDSERLPPLGDGTTLHWKFSDGQTSQLQDQGYGSERSPEEEYPPPLPEHDMDQCHHHLEAHSCYPFITPESTFTVKLIKGSRGLGLSVTGGIESGGSWPGLVRVKRLFPHQPASTCGLLNVGDLLLEANGVPLTGLTNYEALEVLRTATNQVELKVCRPPPDVLNCVSPISEVPPPPPTRREPPNSLNLSSNFFGTTPEDEYFHGEFEITLTKIQGSLGFTLRKEDDSALGHYVRALVREPALTDGRIKAGDRIIAANDVEIFPMSHEQAVQHLRQCGDTVKLRLYRDTPQTPVSTLSPTEGTPRTSFSRKPHLRQEAVDILNDIAVRKLLPNQTQVARRSLSPTSSPRRLRRSNHPSDASQDAGIKYIIPEEQFHEGMLKCKHFDEESFNSLFTIDSDDVDRPSRPNSLDLYNPNQTPVAARKPKFNFSLAHNAYELNNLDPELLDAPNLTYTIGEEGAVPEIDSVDSFPKEPASMPHIPLDSASTKFSHKNPAYQSAHPPCVELSSSSASNKGNQPAQKEETDTIKRKKGILKKDSSSSRYADKTETKTDEGKIVPMKEQFEILAIELNRGWNSRLGFSLQGAAGVTYVSAVYADSVAAKDGRIKPGDRIIKVNDEDVEHMSTGEIIDLLRIVRGPVCIVVKRIKSTEDCGKSNAEN